MKNYNNKKHSQRIIREAMEALGLSEDMKTDPLVMQALLKEIHLEDFESNFPPIKKLLKELATRPRSFRPLFKDIKKGIVDKHPAIVEFLELALERNWLSQSDLVIRSAHVAFLLEFLTTAMCNNASFFEELYLHITDKERQFGVDSKHPIKTFARYLSLTDDYFEIAKTMSVDPIMVIFRPEFINFDLKKERLKSLLKNKQICYLEYKILSHKKGVLGLDELLKINIFEAGISEYQKGFRSNAICAYELSEYIDIKKTNPRIKKTWVLPEKSRNASYKLITKGKRNNQIISMPMSQGWVSLYESWNLAFMLSEIQNLDLLLPKLLIPSVINSKPEHYLQARVIALWISINNVILRKCSSCSEVLGPPYKKEMAHAWGVINKKYAVELARREINEESVVLMNHYRKFFQHPFWNFFKLLRQF
jgi:hypothetical protein